MLIHVMSSCWRTLIILKISRYNAVSFLLVKKSYIYSANVIKYFISSQLSIYKIHHS